MQMHHISPSPLPFISMQHTFQTTDSNLATYLYARSYEILRIDTYQGRPHFTFAKDAELGAEAFYCGASIPAKLLLHAAQRLEEMRKQPNNA